MLDILGSQTGRLCDGTNRRDFLKIGAVGTTGFLLPDLLRSRAAAADAGQPCPQEVGRLALARRRPNPRRDFDPKMSAPAEFRSTLGSVPNQRSRHRDRRRFPKMASVADKMAFVRSFAHATPATAAARTGS